MCFNAPVSLGTFIGGILVSLAVMTIALLRKDAALAILAGGWVWVIFMQWWEYMIWSGWQTPMASKMAYVFNITQIPILYLLFIIPSPASLWSKALATAFLALYLAVMFYPSAATTRVVVHSGHLTYPWWGDWIRCFMYFAGLAGVFLLLVRPFTWGLVCVVSLFILLGLSMLIYGRGNVPSLWCFFAVFFPVLAFAFRLMIDRK